MLLLGAFPRCAVALAAIALLLVAGCGGGGDSGTQPGRETLTKKQYVRRAQAYCHRGYLKQAKAVKRFSKAHGLSTVAPNQAEREKANKAIVLGFVERRIAFLKSLPVPEGDEKEIQAIIRAMEEGLETAKRNPAAWATSDPEPFLENRRLTAAYGFWLCGQG